MTSNTLQDKLLLASPSFMNNGEQGSYSTNVWLAYMRHLAGLLPEQLQAMGTRVAEYVPTLFLKLTHYGDISQRE